MLPAVSTLTQCSEAHEPSKPQVAINKLHKLWISMEMFWGSGCGSAVRRACLDGQIGKRYSRNEVRNMGLGQTEREKQTRVRKMAIILSQGSISLQKSHHNDLKIIAETVGTVLHVELAFCYFSDCKIGGWPLSGKIKLCKVVITANLSFPLKSISHL